MTRIKKIALDITTLPLFVFCCLGSDCLAQYVKYNKASNGTNVITIPYGEVWQIVTYSANWNNADSAAVIYSSTNQSSDSLVGRIPVTRGFLVGLNGASSGAMGSGFVGSIISGPAFIYPYADLSDYYFLFKKNSDSTTGSMGSTSVVIPTTASGDVDIKLEQSADNVTWTECLPGTYNSSTVKRFFRLRAVEK